MAFPMNKSDLKQNYSKVEKPYDLKGCLNGRLGILAYAMLIRPHKAKTAVPGGLIPRVM